jgi:hypothetical protein
MCFANDEFVLIIDIFQIINTKTKNFISHIEGIFSDIIENIFVKKDNFFLQKF